jgi:hypothetical protein
MIAAFERVMAAGSGWRKLGNMLRGQLICGELAEKMAGNLWKNSAFLALIDKAVQTSG